MKCGPDSVPHSAHPTNAGPRTQSIAPGIIPGMRRKTTIRTTVHLVRLLFLAGLVPLAGCQIAEPQPTASSETQPASQPGRSMAEHMHDMAMTVDITGSLEARDKQKAMLDAIRERTEELDVEGFNQAVAQLNEAVKLLTERIAALTPEMIAAAGENAVAATANARKQIETLDIEQANKVLAETTRTITDIRETVNQLKEQLDTTNTHTQGMIDTTKQRIDELPIDELRTSIIQFEKTLISIDRTSQQLPTMAEQLNATLGTARTTFRIVIVAVLTFGLCALIWLVRFLPRGRES